MQSYLILILKYFALAGGWDGGSNRNEILGFEGGVWTEVATMQHGRNMHAVSAINIEEYWKFFMF